MALILGLDIGGANTKCCYLEADNGNILQARGDSAYCPIWRKPEELKDVLRRFSISRRLAGKTRPDAIALTTTAELCDGFSSKAQGVTAILEMTEEVFSDVPVYVWTMEGSFSCPARIKKEPLPAAAANWLASAEALAKSPLLKEEAVLLADMGSTTTDLLPVASGKVLVKGRTDTERLLQGELLYTGVLRTEVQAILDEVYLDGFPCGTAREYFAVSADAYRLLGLITEAQYDAPTPDGKGKDPEACAKRLARMVAAEPEELGQGAVYRIAGAVLERQTRQIMDGILRLMSRKDLPRPTMLLTTGQGSFILRESARRLRLSCAPWWRLIPGARGQLTMTGFSVAWLLAHKLRETM